MKTIYDYRNNLNLINGCEISKQDFEKLFNKTNEKIRFTFNGWDGKSYDGESRTARVLKANIKDLEDTKFVKVGKSIHYVGESMILDKTTGNINPDANWFVDVK